MEGKNDKVKTMSETVLSTVYTYGAGKVLFYVFNAIAMLFNGGFMASLFNLMLMLSLCWAGLKAGINRDSHKEYAKWFELFICTTRFNSAT